MDSALHRPDRAPADYRRFLAGETGRGNEDERFTLISRDLRERSLQFIEFDPAKLLGTCLQPFGEPAIAIFDLATALAILGSELIAQNREEPSRQVRARLERMNIRQSTQQGF